MEHAGSIIFSGDEGISLLADVWGAPRYGIVLLAHGGGQTRHAWSKTAIRLAENGWQAIAIDLRGHGESNWSPTGDYRIDRFGADLVQVAAQIGGKPALVGASLGGIAGIMAETMLAPSTFRSLTLVDITPRMDPAGVSKVMGFMSQHLEDGFSSLEEVAEFIGSYLPGRKKPSDLSGLLKNLRLHSDGRYRWHWDPRFVTSVQTGRGDPAKFNAELSNLAVPVHLIRGRQSEMVSEQAVRDFLAAVPHAKYTDVENAGHMVAGDRNDIFTDAVISFLMETI
jgi:pimeloyl-ACP methyl ester carboxylesterase